MEYKMIGREKFQVVGVKKVISFREGQNLVEIPKFWEQVWADGTMDQLERLANKEVANYMGICHIPEELKPKQEMNYWIVTEYAGEAPEGMDVFEVPKFQWAVFRSVGALPEAIQQTWQNIFAEWLLTSGYKHASGPEIEVYGPGDSKADDYECEVWIPVTQK
ncbi:AraC family transcriptional regulator [Listeria grandensis]|uniref:GyrI-like domain-containing protein n=1 Tax=Listeria grandensis TaxID=1494963 RepID=UPI0016269A5A|nr:GyrI-like domain-containing protein [Listeria grandensis]MBC1475911.1 AraC family transcriptional regulator [Listeria grandensis]